MRAEMDQIFFLDDEEKALIGRRRGARMRPGFGSQVVTVRYLGCFLTDPLDVATEVLDVVAEQLGIEDALLCEAVSGAGEDPAGSCVGDL
ncbi:hypothetical protein GCM10029978_074600 [Actinoallomurus acanthiterrae]